MSTIHSSSSTIKTTKEAMGSTPIDKSLKHIQNIMEESPEAKENLRIILEIVDKARGGKKKSLNHILKFLDNYRREKSQHILKILDKFSRNKKKSLRHILRILDESHQGQKCLEKILRILDKSQREKKKIQPRHLNRAQILKWVRSTQASMEKYAKSKEESDVALKPFIKPWPKISPEGNEIIRRSRSLRAFDCLTHSKADMEEADCQNYEDCSVGQQILPKSTGPPASPLEEGGEFLIIHVDEDTSWLTGPIPAFYKDNAKPILMYEPEEEPVQWEE